MKPTQDNIWRQPVILIFAVITLCAASAIAEESQTYPFAGMFPAMDQPWYFYDPCDVTIDGNGYVYVADSGNHQVQKFTSDGRFVTRWGKKGTGTDEFDYPIGIASDMDGFIYVADMNNHRVRKFNSDGKTVGGWGQEGSGNGEFRLPHGIAIDGSGFVYVVDTGNNRIQKFTADGIFAAKWGDENPILSSPEGIAVDSDGRVYVADTNNDRIIQFTSDGKPVSKPWGTSGDNDGAFRDPHGIAVRDGFVYVTDKFNHRVQKFTIDGKFVSKWGSEGSKDREFNVPYSLAADSAGFIYVADKENNRIQKFTSDGTFVSRWGTGSENGEFNSPAGMAFAPNGEFLYVMDSGNQRIQKRSPDGKYIAEWDGDGLFNQPYGIATDSDGSVYVADSGNDMILKFRSDGKYVVEENWSQMNGQFFWLHGIAIGADDRVLVADTGNHRIQVFNKKGEVIGDPWGKFGNGDGQFNLPRGIAIDNAGNIYVADTKNYRVQKFDPSGKFLTKWGSQGSGDGQFELLFGIAVDDDDYVYVADSENHRIQKFSSEGKYIAQFGEMGIDPGQMNWPAAIAVDANGTVWVADTDNHRIQMFKPVASDISSKAVIVAGGGPYPGNHLWDATRMCANFAYRTLIYQGFNKKDIYYLTSETWLDLDNNGQSDDVYGVPSVKNLCGAIQKTGNAENLILYLVDHGSKGNFRLSDAELMAAAELDECLGQTSPAETIVIYDACNAGSFVSALDSVSAGRTRILISSTENNENAYFINQGAVSFSFFFWNAIFNGENVEKAFEQSSDAISKIVQFQNPAILAVGDILPKEFQIGYGIKNRESRSILKDHPVIETLADSFEITVTTEVDNSEIASVWAIIMPSDYQASSSDTPIIEMPAIDLLPDENRQRNYKGCYDGFDLGNDHQVVVYARDRNGNISGPKFQAVSMDKAQSRKAVILAGCPSSEAIFDAVIHNGGLAYNALIYQGYGDDDIVYMTPSTDAHPSLSHLKEAFDTLASENIRDVVIYITGKGLEGKIQINDTESLTAVKLDGMLANLQARIGNICVILDADYSGSFLPILTNKNANGFILIAGSAAHEKAVLMSETNKDDVYIDMPFSGFFWRSILIGMNVRSAFQTARDSVTMYAHASGFTGPLLDDNGNGIGNEFEDGLAAMQYSIGLGVKLSGDDPLIGNIPTGKDLNGKTWDILRAENVNAAGSEIQNVIAVITLPGSDLETETETIRLEEVRPGRYEGRFEKFDRFGSYPISVYAIDDKGNSSLARKTIYEQSRCGDVYEPDDAPEYAKSIVINSPTPQHRNLGSACEPESTNITDQDWIRFYAFAQETYTLELRCLESNGSNGSNCPAIMEIFDEAGKFHGTPITSWSCETEGVYYVKISNRSDMLQADTAYEIKIYQPIAPIAGFLKGIVKNGITGAAIDQTVIKIDNAGDETLKGKGSDLSRPSGRYLIIHEPGMFSVTFEAPNYRRERVSNVIIREGGITVQNIELYTDANSNGIPDEQETGIEIDLDRNGISDSVQNDIKSVNTADNNSRIGIKAGQNGVSIERMKAVRSEDAADVENIPESLPMGLITFSVNVERPGDTAFLTVYFSTPPPEAGRWYVYDVRNGWQDHSEQVTFSSDRQSMTFEITDGGHGDEDGIENGTIISTAGIGIPNIESQPISSREESGNVGGAGCFVETIHRY